MGSPLGLLLRGTSGCVLTGRAVLAVPRGTESTSSAQEAAVSLLLDAGADTTQTGYEGKTAAEWAEESGNPRLAAQIRRAPTRRGRWMAAEQRLAMATLLHVSLPPPFSDCLPARLPD